MLGRNNLMRYAINSYSPLPLILMIRRERDRMGSDVDNDAACLMWLIGLYSFVNKNADVDILLLYSHTNQYAHSFSIAVAIKIKEKLKLDATNYLSTRQ